MVPLTSTSYPTLGVIHTFGITDPKAIRAVYARSAVWADRARAKEEFWVRKTGLPKLEIRSPRTISDLYDILGDELGWEVDQALYQAQRRAQNWCLEHR